MKKRAFFSVLIFLLSSVMVNAAENAVMPKTHTRVLVREHPRTGKPYVVITDRENAPDPFALLRTSKPMMRPDYRMLDPKIKSGQIPYEGPVSDRRKVYIFAGSLAALGTAGGAAMIAAAPAATGAGAAGGAGVFAGAGAGVAAGSVAGTVAAAKSDPNKESFKHTAESHVISNPR